MLPVLAATSSTVYVAVYVFVSPTWSLVEFEVESVED